MKSKTNDNKVNQNYQPWLERSKSENGSKNLDLALITDVAIKLNLLLQISSNCLARSETSRKK